MLNLKLIAFNMLESVGGIPEAASLCKRLIDVSSLGEDARGQLVNDLRLYGIAIARPTLERMIGANQVEGILNVLSPDFYLREVVMTDLLPRMNGIIAQTWHDDDRREYNMVPRFRRVLEKIGITQSQYDDFLIQKCIIGKDARLNDGVPICSGTNAPRGKAALVLLEEIVAALEEHIPKSEIFLLRFAERLFKKIRKIRNPEMSNPPAEKLQEIADEILRVLGGLPEMVEVRAGNFAMGNAESVGPVRRIRRIEISAFKIGRHPVTNAEYQRFLDETGKAPEHPSDPANSQHPADLVSWHDAVSYCEWLSHKTGKQYGLPTEAEWEYAARGMEGRTYPFGYTFELEKVVACAAHAGTKPVGERPDGASWCGAEDMIGQLSEWCFDWMAAYDENDTVDPRGPAEGINKAIRGGNFVDDSSLRLTCYLRDGARPDSKERYIGFRVVEVVEDV
ncbi:MAG: SUMF1/EgtB/PvdO family nonheme iron enzyme [Candidatus Saganbacteria bacterium]|nr:SUMF1/EgtB/PvdO family nonheme iron enzyme [Candidatus Saganbacteria bacterium]